MPLSYRKPLLFAADVLVLTGVVGAGPADAARRPSAPANVALRTSGGALVVAWAWRPATTYTVRWRRSSARKWRLVRAGARGSARIRRLRPRSVSYSVGVRGCSRGRCSRGRCSRWSATVRNRAPRKTGPPSSTTIGGCSVFPANNAWNEDVSDLPVDPRLNAYVAAIRSQGDSYLHADFGADPSYGIPFSVVSAAPFLPVNFTEYGAESDPGPYPVPLTSPVEAGADAHVLTVDSASCKLYEMYHARPAAGGWDAGSGAVFDLGSNSLRPDTWTSTDQAGLPVLPGLVRFDEVSAGAITHALRFTSAVTQRAFIHPATHYGDSGNQNYPPMGLRLRLKAGFNTSSFHGEALVVLVALKKYGMFLADTGTSWFITGATDGRWDDADLNQLKTVPGSAFEAVQTGAVHRP